MSQVMETSHFLKNVDPGGLPESGDLHGVLRELQASGHRLFQSMRFPDRRMEDWRYMPLETVVSKKYHVTHRQVNPQCDVFDQWRGPSGVQLIFNNGHFAPGESRLHSLPEGVRLVPLTAITDMDAALLKRLFAAREAHTEGPFEALNQALLRQGVLLHVPRGVVLEEPVLIANFASTFDQNFITNPRLIVFLESGAQAVVLESHLCFSEMPYFNNAVTDIVLEDGAVLHYGRVQADSLKAHHLGSTRITLGRDARLRSCHVAMGGAISRQEMAVHFRGSGAEAVLDGLYSGCGTQFMGQHTAIHHHVPHCVSRQVYKGILAEQSRAVFNGKILVRRNAQGSDSSQLNKNLLLSPLARVDTKPQLEIDADDVKCTHGATVGQLNPEELFYLQSRGISGKVAVSMLVHGFIDSLLQKVEHPWLKKRFRALVTRYTKGIEGKF